MTMVQGNKNGNVAICTLWTNAEEVSQRLDKEDFFLCGNLYSSGGINSLLRTVLAHPNIRYIIVYGADSNGSGRDLLKLFKFGIDKNRHIQGTEIVIEKELGDAFEEVRKNVGIIDLRNTKLSDLRSKVATLAGKKLRPFSRPRKFPESKRSVLKIPSERVGYLIKAKSFSEAWLKILDMILKFGVEAPKKLELLNLEAGIDGGNTKLPFSWKLKPLRSATAYTFGSRLSKKIKGKSVLDRAIEKLRRGRQSVVISLWTDKDFDSKSAPRLTMLRLSVKDRELIISAHFRSHDTYHDWPVHTYAVRELQKRIAKQLNLKVGPLDYLSTSPYISKKDVNSARKMVSKHYKPDFSFKLDPRGAFVIKVKNHEIVVTHVTADGQKTGHEFRGKDPEVLYKLIFHENLVSLPEHAAYLGLELQKAKMAIKLGKKYVQEEEL